MKRILKFLLLSLLILNNSLEAKYPDLTPQIVNSKTKEIFSAHATQKKLSPELVKRVLNVYLELLDPTKTYFIRSDIDTWLNPSESQLEAIVNAMNNKDYTVFKTIYLKMAGVIPRHRALAGKIDINSLPKKVSAKEFKDLQWLDTEEQLQERLTRIKALQIETSTKLADELKEKALQRIEKRQQKYEEEILTTDTQLQNNFIYTQTLKAISSALDGHTTYFTPEEATQFLIQVQQRLFGIGAQLRDDLNGFTVVKLVEGGPAARSEQLKVKDRIIAVNGEPVVGMDIVDAVQLIRGAENTPVVLTVIRDKTNEDNTTTEEKLDVTIQRGEVVLTESRYESKIEPVGDANIAYLRLHSFYQDPESCSTSDLKKSLEAIKKKGKVAGVILDLRNNSGGILAQAVGVAGLFITKGVVVSIVDDKGNVQHLRNIDPDVTWDGPLIVLINRGSASASEIVAGALKDYGRGIIVGDDHSYGKGSFQTFTLNGNQTTEVNPAGEFKVTRGRYYTVSGKTPQLVGVASDILVPGPLSESEVGEKFTKFPLENNQIKPSFFDDLEDIPIPHRQQFRMMYRYNLQPQLHTYDSYLPLLKQNSTKRIDDSADYQAFLREIRNKDDIVEGEDDEDFGKDDLQLKEAYNIMKDLIILQNS